MKKWTAIIIYKDGTEEEVDVDSICTIRYYIETADRNNPVVAYRKKGR